MKRSPLPCTWLFPLCAILLWVCIIAGPATLNYSGLVHAAHGASAVTVLSGNYHFVVPRHQFWRWSLDSASMAHGNLNEALNIFGLAGEALASAIFKTWPDSWYPDGFDLMSWRGVVYPFFCLPLWVFVGWGFDGLLNRRRLHWGTLLLGTLFCSFALLMAALLRFDTHYPEDSSDNYRVSGLVLWSLLTAAFPLQWLLRIKRAGGPPAT